MRGLFAKAHIADGWFLASEPLIATIDLLSHVTSGADVEWLLAKVRRRKRSPAKAKPAAKGDGRSRKASEQAA